ncbi:MAG: hypothetical protein RL536_194 [Candidatus Parcubacteria bacterium]
MPKSITKQALTNGILTGLYIISVGLFMSHTKDIFGPEDNFFIPIALLLLLVFSASICGALVLGTPILWYLDGKKNEAVKLFGVTISVSLFRYYLFLQL